MDILVIASRFPWPLEKGDKLRLYHQVRLLSRHYRIHLFALSHSPISREQREALEPWCTSLHVATVSWWRLPANLLLGLLQGLPVSVAYFTDPAAQKRLQQVIREVKPALLFGQLIRVGEYIRQKPQPRLLDFMDAFSEIMQRRERIGAPWLRPFIRMEARRLQRYESALGADMDRCTYISERDRDAIDPQQGWPGGIVPNGIDLDYFQAGEPRTPGYELVFVGNLGYFPNIAACRFLVREVMPHVWAHQPDCRLLIAGARPDQDVQQLAGPKVTVQGWMPDIREAYRDGRIFVAPLFQGAGLQNKILEAMAMGLPVVTTRHVNAALGARDGLELQLAETPEAFGQAIIGLLQNPAGGETLREAGMHFVRENFNWAKNVALLNQLGIEPLIQTHGKQP